MSAVSGFRSLGSIAQDIAARVYLPPNLRAYVDEMAARGWIENDSDYWKVANVHCALRLNRSHTATRLEQELKAMLALYRAERW